MSNIFIPDEFPCPICEDETLGQAVDDISAVLCRECSLEWIWRAEGDTLEECILSCEGHASTLEEAEEIAVKMRAQHAINVRAAHEHWIALFASIVQAAEDAFLGRLYANFLLTEAAEVALRLADGHADGVASKIADEILKMRG